MQTKIHRWLVSLLVVSALALGGCASFTEDPTSANSPATAETNEVTSTSPVVDAGAQFSDLPRLEGEATVQLVVNGEPIIINVDGTNAPITAGNFVDLVQRGVYDGTTFHRVVREPQPFVVQGGDPQSKDPSVPAERLGTGGFVDPDTSSPRYIPLEIKPEGQAEPIYGQTFEDSGTSQPPQLRHTEGAVAMARSALPDSASSQFYIALSELGFLDGSYAVFGYVTDGMDVVESIQQGDRIESARVISGLENLQSGSTAQAPASAEQ